MTRDERRALVVLVHRWWEELLPLVVIAPSTPVRIRREMRAFLDDLEAREMTDAQMSPELEQTHLAHIPESWRPFATPQPSAADDGAKEPTSKPETCDYCGWPQKYMRVCSLHATEFQKVIAMANAERSSRRAKGIGAP